MIRLGQIGLGALALPGLLDVEKAAGPGANEVNEVIADIGEYPSSF